MPSPRRRNFDQRCTIASALCLLQQRLACRALCQSSSPPPVSGMAWPLPRSRPSSPNPCRKSRRRSSTPLKPSTTRPSRRCITVGPRSTSESTDGTPGARIRRVADCQEQRRGRARLYRTDPGRTVSTTWPTGAWRYLYLVSASGVASLEISSTAPQPFFASPLFQGRRRDAALPVRGALQSGETSSSSR